MRLRDYLPRGRRRPQSLAVRPITTTGPALLNDTTHRQAWQEEAWRAYSDNVGEYAAVVDWRANAISRANLTVARLTRGADTQPEPVTDEPALTGLLEQLGTGGETGYSQMLRMISVHLDVPGETVLVGTETPGGGQLWFPASPDQIEPYGAGWAVRLDRTGMTAPDGTDMDLLVIPPTSPDNPTPTTIMKRIYEPDPRYPWLAISPGRHALKSLRILDRLSDRVNSNTVSRLMNKIVLLSNNVTLPTAPDRADLHNDPQMAGLIQAGSMAIEDPESAAARFPVIARVHGDPSDAIAEVELGSAFDEQLVPLLDTYIRRLALSLNVPPEILLGVTDANHWSAYLVSDDTVRIHLAPTLELICDALTRAYLRPAIAHLNQRAGRVVYDPRDFAVWYNTVRITQRANRAETALASHEAGLISSDSARAGMGWDDADAPDPAEVRADLLMRAAIDGRPPEEVQWYLDQLGLSDAPRRPPRAVPVSPGRGAPAITDTPASVRGM